MLLSYIWIHLYAFVCLCTGYISYQLARAPLVVDSPLPVDVEVAPGGPQNSQWIKLWESSIRRMSGVHLHPGVEGHFENVLCGKNMERAVSKTEPRLRKFQKMEIVEIHLYDENELP